MDCAAYLYMWPCSSLILAAPFLSYDVLLLRVHDLWFNKQNPTIMNSCAFVVTLWPGSEAQSSSGPGGIARVLFWTVSLDFRCFAPEPWWSALWFPCNEWLSLRATVLIMHWSHNWSCTVHLAYHALIMWLIMCWSCLVSSFCIGGSEVLLVTADRSSSSLLGLHWYHPGWRRER